MIRKGKSEKPQKSEQSQNPLRSEAPESYLTPLPLCKFSWDVLPWWSANTEVLPPWQLASPLGLYIWWRTVGGRTGERAREEWQSQETGRHKMTARWELRLKDRSRRWFLGWRGGHGLPPADSVHPRPARSQSRGPSHLPSPRMGSREWRTVLHVNSGQDSDTCRQPVGRPQQKSIYLRGEEPPSWRKREPKRMSLSHEQRLNVLQVGNLKIKSRWIHHQRTSSTSQTFL